MAGSPPSGSRQRRKRRPAPARPTTALNGGAAALDASMAVEAAQEEVLLLEPEGPAEGPMMSEAELAAERRRGWPAAIAGAATVVLTIAAVPVAASGPKILAPAGSDKSLLLGASLAGGAQTTAMWMRVASVLLVIPVALFLYRAVQARNPGHSRYIPVLAIVAFVIVGASTAVGFFEVRHAAHLYVASGPRTTARAKAVLSAQQHTFPLRAADLAQVAGGFLFGIWISLASYEAMRVGLLTRFLGFFGVGAGLTTVIGLPIGPALFIGWLASVACLAVGWWPGGMPPAWRLGRAVSPEETDQLMGQTRRRSRFAG